MVGQAMALTVLIKQEGEDDLALTLDAPRIVIGRSKACEVQLPDPTVSARHAVILSLIHISEPTRPY